MLHSVKAEHCVTDETRLLYNICVLLERIAVSLERAETPAQEPAGVPSEATGAKTKSKKG
jgi:hypothetical protein